MDNIIIRLIKINDLEILSEIYCKVYDAFDVGEKWDLESAYKMLKYWYDRQPDLCFLAEMNEKIVGAFFAAVKPWWDGNHLVDGEIFVNPDHQKKGVGSALSKLMYKTAVKKYNAKYFDTYTFNKSEHPLSWYKNQGFVENKDWVNVSGNLAIVLENLEKNN